jgi:hypothetical protein
VLLSTATLPAFAQQQGAQAQGSQPQGSQPQGSQAPISYNGEEYWLDPDRPHIADSSVNVPKGLFLQENGFQQTYPGHGGVFDIPETLMRLGVLNRTELRLNVPNYVLARDDGRTTQNGVADMQVGLKHRLTKIPGRFQLSVNPFFSVPTGTRRISSHRVDPFVKVPFSYELNDKWDIEGMESFFFPTIDSNRIMDWQNAIVLNRSWGRKSNVFAEYVSDVVTRGRSTFLIHFGAAYRPNRRNQIDCQWGFRLNRSAPIAFFGVGYSFLLGKLERP